MIEGRNFCELTEETVYYMPDKEKPFDYWGVSYAVPIYNGDSGKIVCVQNIEELICRLFQERYMDVGSLKIGW